MKCPNCGAEVREEDKFCGECGVRIKPESKKKWIWSILVLGGTIYFIIWILGYIAAGAFFDFDADDWAIFFIIVILPSLIMISIGYLIKSRKVLTPE